MAQYSVNCNWLRNAIGTIESSSKILYKLESELTDVGEELEIGGSSQPIFIRKISELTEDLSREYRDLKSLGDVLERIVTIYEETEKKLSGYFSTVPVVKSTESANTNNAEKKSEKDNKKSTRDTVKNWLKKELNLPDYVVSGLMTMLGPMLDAYDDNVRDLIGNFPSKSEHYARNDSMPFDSLPQSPEAARMLGWNGNVASDCHQFTAKNGRNQKYVSPDGKYEVIFDANGRMVTAPEDYGTYNFADPSKDGLKHALYDVVPWIIWGNSKADSTTVVQRLKAFAVDGAISKIQGRL